MKDYRKISKRSLFFWYTAVFISAVSGSVFYTLAFQTDSGTLVNQITEGHNTTEIEEDFPPQTLEPGKDAQIEKTVCIKNEDSTANTSCYIRVRIGYSSGDLGDYTIQGRDKDWIESQDGYYYYTGVIKPGEKTKPLMKGLKIVSKGKDALASCRELEIQIYEESCQAVNPDTLKLWTWQEAWGQALGREVKWIET